MVMVEIKWRFMGGNCDWKSFCCYFW